MTVHEFSVNSQQSSVNDFKWNNLFFGVPLQYKSHKIACDFCTTIISTVLQSK
ncbi:hypothetical protein LC613_22215 [Nostoc sphaeroides CHAB 2801]|uniref:hypothetical protein n=1 Tax=Nostoc sphaeroides TaxID=446679 RepID=UPI001C7007DB|nr:hypothetical protein [Nostoc sphaeroides]MCC5630568.1 hypothetical protein [Nostoc sphaeroides CHAB 2801]